MSKYFFEFVTTTGVVKMSEWISQTRYKYYTKNLCWYELQYGRKSLPTV